MQDSGMEKMIIDRLPSQLRDLAKVIGIEPAFKIVKNFGGSYLVIPKCEQLRKEARNERICREYDAGGITKAKLARKYGLSDKQVNDILKAKHEPIPAPLLKLLEGLA